MAATRLIPLHANKGRTVAHSLGDRTDYAKNPEKTEKGELVTAYGCDPMTVDEEFMLQKRMYEQSTGRSRKNEVIAYQIRQSFKPGEITPEDANRVGRETAMRFTKGKYSLIVATHTDRAHIHNHIVFNSTSMDGDRKFRNFWLSSIALQKVSDLVCLENGLSVITPLPYSERSKRTEYPRRVNVRDQICSDIDAALNRKPKDFSEFLQFMAEADYEIKQGTHLAIKGKNQERFIRFSSLEEGYRESDIRAFLQGEITHEFKPLRNILEQKPLGLILEIDRIQREKPPGYVKWATVYNVKQLAKSRLYLVEHQIGTRSQLHEIAAEKASSSDAMLASIRASEAKLTEIAALKKHIINYSKTRSTYEAYRKAGYSKRFFEVHREEITLHKAAKQAFNELGVKKIPKVKDLNQQYAEILMEKKKAYAEYRKIRDESHDSLIVDQNITSLFEAVERGEREHRREEKQH